MYEIEIDKSECKGCGACTKVSQILYLGDDNLINVQGAFEEDGRIEFSVKSLYEIEVPASICPKDCFTVYDEDFEEVKIKRNANLEK